MRFRNAFKTKDERELLRASAVAKNTMTQMLEELMDAKEKAYQEKKAAEQAEYDEYHALKRGTVHPQTGFLYKCLNCGRPNNYDYATCKLCDTEELTDEEYEKIFSGF